MDYISFVGGVLLLYSLNPSVNCASLSVAASRQRRQSIAPDADRIYFQDEFEQYKNQIKYSQINDEEKRFGLDEESIKQFANSDQKKKNNNRRKRQMPGFFGGMNDISGGGGFPGFFPMPGDEMRPIWDITPSTTGRPVRQKQRPRPRPTPEATTLPGPPTWATPPSQCVRNCQITPQYNPVCGTDGITYTNFARLQCEIRCGKVIKLNHYGNCSRTTTQAPRTRRSAPSSKRRQP